jgi:hypothetical protein
MPGLQFSVCITESAKMFILNFLASSIISTIFPGCNIDLTFQVAIVNIAFLFRFHFPLLHHRPYNPTGSFNNCKGFATKVFIWD